MINSQELIHFLNATLCGTSLGGHFHPTIKPPIVKPHSYENTKEYQFQESLSQEELKEYLGQAVNYVGLDDTWVDDPYLVSIIKKESSFQPGIKNPNSSAFGLFQMMKGTWEEFIPETPYGDINPFWQSVGGLRYVSKTYRTPERAYKFYLSTTTNDPTLAPPDLQGKAEMWVQNGFKGY